MNIFMTIIPHKFRRSDKHDHLMQGVVTFSRTCAKQRASLTIQMWPNNTKHTMCSQQTLNHAF